MTTKAERANISSALGAIAADVPTWDKAHGWRVVSRRVNFYRGETAADAASFADAIRGSFELAHARYLAELAVPALGYDATTVTTDARTGARTIPTVPARYAVTVARVVARIASTCSGHTCAPVQAPERPIASVRKPRARKVAPAPVMAPDALTTCNGCDVRPMVGPEHPGYAAGYCAECFAEATDTTPEPDTRPEAIAADAALAFPEPVRLASVPASTTRERPTCPRCGQTFRAGGSGFAWHVANRPDCAADVRQRLAIA